VKVTVVGAGFVGATTAMRVAQKGLSDEVVMVDIVEGLPQGLALDMNQSSPVEGFEPVVRGTNDYADTSGSDVVVITAGLPRQPGMSRMDLLEKNAGIMRDVAGRVKDTSPAGVVVVVSNPLDEMTFLAAEVTGFSRERIMGMAGTLDSARLRSFIGQELGVSPSVVDAMTLGSHGESMVPLPGLATVDGRPLRELVDAATLGRLYERTANAGAEIVGHLKKGSAYYAPSAAVAQMVEAIVGDSKEVLPACVWATGQYGISEVFVGLPARLGRGGVEEVVEMDLDADAVAALRDAANGIRERCRDLQKVS
jgi:malate dehydrogenase